MLGKLINRVTGNTKRKEAIQKEADKRRALSKHAIYGSESYSLHEEAYDKQDFERTSGQLNRKVNLYGQ